MDRLWVDMDAGNPVFWKSLQKTEVKSRGFCSEIGARMNPVCEQKFTRKDAKEESWKRVGERLVCQDFFLLYTEMPNARNHR